MITTDPRFARSYRPGELLENPGRAAEFVRDYVDHEADYFQAARDPDSGLTYDGFDLDPRSGELTDVRFWSAPSKECLDMGILIKALKGDELATRLVSAEQAARILSQKLDSYEAFQRQQPGYGGFLPWFYGGTSLHPAPDWKGDAPGMDNGEWVWTMLVAEKALKDSGHNELAQRYANYNQRLQENVVKMFFDPEARKVRGDVHIADPWSAGTTYHTNHGVPGRADYLSGEHGVHEGMMLVLYLTLFGQGLPEGAAERIWDGIAMKRVEHPAGTTWEGFWASAHESWAYLFLPLRDMEGYRKLFRVREQIRTQNAEQRDYPGFATSANEPGRDSYIDGAGIENIASQPIRNNHTYALYGAFPLLLEFAGKTGPNPGLVWLHNMLLGPQMQGPAGGGEAGTNDGRMASHVKTVDGTFPNLLALMGGIERETAEMLRERGLYERFRAIMQAELDETFAAAPLRESGAYALPDVLIPQVLPPYEDWMVCSSSP
ncbi:hypothetical protein DYH09_10145 [bacterium CPR1]|nr:hypothetical protein [bacterium CPR1]